MRFAKPRVFKNVQILVAEIRFFGIVLIWLAEKLFLVQESQFKCLPE
jgi:hypothetical protein